MKNLTTEDLKFFNKNGYLIIKNLIPKKKINYILGSVKDYIKFNFSNYSNQYVSTDNILKELRKKNKKKFGTFFDSFQTLGCASNILTEEKILLNVSKLLKTKFNNLTFTDFSIRFDPPLDERNSLGWHQDSSYFRQNSDGRNGIVVWSPLVDLNKKMGPLEFLKNSHNTKTFSIKKIKSHSRYTSDSREINNQITKKFKIISPDNIKSGDAIIMNLNMIHRSGKNLSNKFRISIIGRYHKMLSEDFNSGLNKYIYSDKKLNTSIHGKI